MMANYKKIFYIFFILLFLPLLIEATPEQIGSFSDVLIEEHETFIFSTQDVFTPYNEIEIQIRKKGFFQSWNSIELMHNTSRRTVIFDGIRIEIYHLLDGIGGRFSLTEIYDFSDQHEMRVRVRDIGGDWTSWSNTFLIDGYQGFYFDIQPKELPHIYLDFNDDVELNMDDAFSQFDCVAVSVQRINGAKIDSPLICKDENIFYEYTFYIGSREIGHFMLDSHGDGDIWFDFYADDYTSQYEVTLFGFQGGATGDMVENSFMIYIDYVPELETIKAPDDMTMGFNTQRQYNFNNYFKNYDTLFLNVYDDTNLKTYYIELDNTRPELHEIIKDTELGYVISINSYHDGTELIVFSYEEEVDLSFNVIARNEYHNSESLGYNFYVFIEESIGVTLPTQYEYIENFVIPINDVTVPLYNYINDFTKNKLHFTYNGEDYLLREGRSLKYDEIEVYNYHGGNSQFFVWEDDINITNIYFNASNKHGYILTNEFYINKVPEIEYFPPINKNLFTVLNLGYNIFKEYSLNDYFSNYEKIEIEYFNPIENETVNLELEKGGNEDIYTSPNLDIKLYYENNDIYLRFDSKNIFTTMREVYINAINNKGYTTQALELRIRDEVQLLKDISSFQLKINDTYSIHKDDIFIGADLLILGFRYKGEDYSLQSGNFEIFDAFEIGIKENNTFYITETKEKAEIRDIILIGYNPFHQRAIPEFNIKIVEEPKPPHPFWDLFSDVYIFPNADELNTFQKGIYVIGGMLLLSLIVFLLSFKFSFSDGNLILVLLFINGLTLMFYTVIGYISLIPVFITLFLIGGFIYLNK